ncbi:Nif3-like dinuclear metal center hexameric protein [Halobacillus mangrovi]|uniref:Nif3-like dinuclear metal center hexameric protein n=1 Tax=Halobacillus mangrovi TaxID=402384 RepID=UPI003D975BD7
MTETKTAQEVIREFEKWSPKHLAFDWDNVGLQIGTLNKPIENVMVTLDVLENVVDEAIEKNVDLIIAHHPVLFVKLSEINFDTPKGRVIRKLIQHDITVYAAHTNLDVAKGGVNDVMAEALNLENVKPLLSSQQDDLVKLTVFVPEEHADALRNAVSNAGAGHIGNYSHCTYQLSGEGTFKPLEGTNPYIGSKGELEMVKEKRIETIVPKSKLKDVLKAMEEAHPYEEVAYDLYPLLNEGETLGAGRIGRLPEPVSLEELCRLVKEKYSVPTVRFVGENTKPVKKVALLGGSGEKFIHQAKRSGADVYITGDLTFHLAQDAKEMGLSIIDPGHHVEKIICQKVKDYLEKHCNQDSRLNIMISEANTEPFEFI